jgi:hypothetical protein
MRWSASFAGEPVGETAGVSAEPAHAAAYSLADDLPGRDLGDSAAPTQKPADHGVPSALYDFGAGVMRWRRRVEAYMLLMVDEYPPFSLQ